MPFFNSQYFNTGYPSFKKELSFEVNKCSVTTMHQEEIASRNKKMQRNTCSDFFGKKYNTNAKYFPCGLLRLHFRCVVKAVC